MTGALDSTDLAIIDLLVRDGRQPAAQIAERIGLSRPAVAERIDKLEREGILRGTTAVIDPRAFGREVTAFISARRQGKLDAKAKSELRRILARDEVLEMHSVAGEDCYLLKVRTESIGSLNTLVSELTGAPLALSTRTTIVLATHCEKVGGIALFPESVE